MSINYISYLSIISFTKTFLKLNYNCKQEQYWEHHYIACQSLINLDHCFIFSHYFVVYLNFYFNFHFWIYEFLFIEMSCPWLNFRLTQTYFIFCWNASLLIHNSSFSFMLIYFPLRI